MIHYGFIDKEKGKKCIFTNEIKIKYRKFNSSISYYCKLSNRILKIITGLCKKLNTIHWASLNNNQINRK